jgi:hypothetical protein
MFLSSSSCLFGVRLQSEAAATLWISLATIPCSKQKRRRAALAAALQKPCFLPPLVQLHEPLINPTSVGRKLIGLWPAVRQNLNFIPVVVLA